MINAAEARATYNIFSKRAMVGFEIYLANQNRGENIEKAISDKSKDGYTSYSFQIPYCYRTAIEPYFTELGYKVVAILNTTDDSLIDVDIFW